MVSVNNVRNILRDLNDHTGWRFAVGVRIRFANPTLLFQTYPQEWIDYYNDNALIFTDPTIRWGLSHTGVCDWDDLRADDGAGMMTKAAEHGLRFGIVVSVGDVGSRTLGFFCHADRPLTAEVIAFGDHQNDIEMLRMAGMGVAMGNSLPDVQACADWVTGSNDGSGIADALQRFVLTPA